MKKSKLILLQVFIAFILICTSVYAAFDTTISLSTSSTSIKRGEEVIVTLSLENVDSNKKVESIEGYINYNKDILEPVTVDSIVKSDNNTVTIGNEELSVEDLTNKTEVSTSDAYVAFNGTPSSDNDIKIVIDLKNGITSNIDLLKIKFKAKADAKLGTVSNAISYEMFQITAGSETSPDITKNVNLTVVAQGDKQEPENKAKDPVENETKNPAENKAENKNQNEATNNAVKNTNNTANNTNKVSNQNTNTKDDTVAGTKLPATGAKVLVIPAIVLIVVAYISYNKYIKYKDI